MKRLAVHLSRLLYDFRMCVWEPEFNEDVCIAVPSFVDNQQVISTPTAPLLSERGARTNVGD